MVVDPPALRRQEEEMAEPRVGARGALQAVAPVDQPAEGREAGRLVGPEAAPEWEVGLG